ncbi:hypothetical protein COT44_01675 [Candidatus Shapirobacteria bacterium CG08_land_8_20_14_0_20_39_18]|uniref:Cytotoxin n=1 Tax=Candidatus Shapirobacteria bacterium CG08_land_8_20_14_0_20_39_18 TaxID=1974883 RepID=A0A2M6XDG3_9BACT|nr:MAG: hypothetical protein COT44_01675 [Candidatus Shapirobacteria bacterium CG08_land_8_20_14_0_20_39_18]PIY65205.1 MAG: hypothetical protein COY91_03255 [Candidatus Shapirobacteria bacterium CG_4_10_14_0_8_um_filter_39_15]PJE68069.1 MAG: hypothetical protein COU94_03890 [Candidatus Shapirobacteria bacterium CG10_big_fil_rev_8_21_14_0_10_38_8]
MKLLVSAHFKKDYKKLPQKIQIKVDKQLRILAQNPSHPSLQVKKMKGEHSKYQFWEVRIDLFWRMSFQKDKDVIKLCRLGPHDEVVKNISQFFRGIA